MDTTALKEKIIAEFTDYRKDGFLAAHSFAPELYTTSELAVEGPELHYTGGVRFGPVWSSQIFYSLLIALAITGITDGALMDYKKQFPMPFALVWLIISVPVFFVYRLIRPLNQVIKVTAKGIDVNGDWFGWQDVLATFILSIHGPQGGRIISLIIV